MADEAGLSPWQRFHGVPFHGRLIPLGARVTFKPNTTKKTDVQKMGPQTIDGIFVGYVLDPGLKWSGEYMAIALDDFANKSLAINSSAFGEAQFRFPHRVKRVNIPGTNFQFPLKEEYDRINLTLRGATERKQPVASLLGDIPSTDPRPTPTVQSPQTDHWVPLGGYAWVRWHHAKRVKLYSPGSGGPSLGGLKGLRTTFRICLLYTSDAADDP